MATWVLQPQEQEGTFLFGGVFTCTKEVCRELSDEEIHSIQKEIIRAVNEKGCLGNLQTFIDENGRRLYVLDSMNKEAIESEVYDINDPYVYWSSLMFAHELHSGTWLE